MRRVGSALAMAAWMMAAGCGGGVPVKLRIDEFAFDLDIDQTIGQAEQQLISQGFLPSQLAGLPELWPDSLPDIRYSTALQTPSIPVDLTPAPDSENAKKYERINRVKDVVQRIEINRLVLRLEQNSMSIALPALELQAAAELDADPADRKSWYTVGVLPPTEPGEVVDLTFEFVKGGESFLNSQLGDDQKELALRTVGNLVIDTAENPARPRGKAKIRLIVEATFFVTPEGLLK